MGLCARPTCNLVALVYKYTYNVYSASHVIVLINDINYIDLWTILLMISV